MRSGAIAARSPIAAGRVLDFRRRAIPPRRRRRSPMFALARPLALALSAVALPVGLSSWVLTSRRFDLQEIVVTPSARVPPTVVRAALAPFAGRNLVLVSLAEASARLTRLPWIASAELRKELPDRLLVRVTERRPVVLLAGPRGIAFADAGGRPIAPVGSAAELAAARRQGLLEVSFGATSGDLAGGIAGALRVAEQLRRVHPEWAARLSRIEALGEDDFRLYSEALPSPVLVNGGHLEVHLRRLEEVLPLLVRHYAGLAAIDLRFTRRIVVQPSVPVVPQRRGEGRNS